MNKAKADLAEIVKRYVVKRKHKVARYPGDKTSKTCPRCGKERFGFIGGFKCCRHCGFNNYWEPRVKTVKWLIKRGRLAEIDYEILQKCANYIQNLKPLEE